MQSRLRLPEGSSAILGPRRWATERLRSSLSSPCQYYEASFGQILRRVSYVRSRASYSPENMPAPLDFAAFSTRAIFVAF